MGALQKLCDFLKKVIIIALPNSGNFYLDQNTNFYFMTRKTKNKEERKLIEDMTLTRFFVFHFFGRLSHVFIC